MQLHRSADGVDRVERESWNEWFIFEIAPSMIDPVEDAMGYPQRWFYTYMPNWDKSGKRLPCLGVFLPIGLVIQLYREARDLLKMLHLPRKL